MDIDLAQRAISAALSGNWKDALKFNLQIVSDNPKDIDALNRLARCYAELGQVKRAVLTCEKALKIDPFNSIAVKSHKKWKTLKSGEKTNGQVVSSPELFLEEPGKTKLVYLLHVGDHKTLATLDCGDEVRLNPKSHRIPVLELVEARRIGRELVAQCPVCAAEGHDRHRDNLRIKPDGSVFCCTFGGPGQIHKTRDIIRALRSTGQDAS